MNKITLFSITHRFVNSWKCMEPSLPKDCDINPWLIQFATVNQITLILITHRFVDSWQCIVGTVGCFRFGFWFVREFYVVCQSRFQFLLLWRYKNKGLFFFIYNMRLLSFYLHFLFWQITKRSHSEVESKMKSKEYDISAYKRIKQLWPFEKMLNGVNKIETNDGSISRNINYLC